MLFSTVKKLSLVAFCMAAFALPARADNFQHAFTTIPQAWTGPFRQNIRLNDAGALVIPFSNPASGIVSVTFNAECSVNGHQLNNVAVTILIDDAAVPPSGFDAAFCNGRGSIPNLSRYSLTVNRVLAAGAHNLKVFAQAKPVTVLSPISARLDDITVLVER